MDKAKKKAAATKAAQERRAAAKKKNPVVAKVELEVVVITVVGKTATILKGDDHRRVARCVVCLSCVGNP